MCIRQLADELHMSSSYGTLAQVTAHLQSLRAGIDSCASSVGSEEHCKITSAAMTSLKHLNETISSQDPDLHEEVEADLACRIHRVMIETSAQMDTSARHLQKAV